MLEILLTAEGNFLLWLQNSVRNDILDPVFVFITTFGNGGTVCACMNRCKRGDEACQ